MKKYISTFTIYLVIVSIYTLFTVSNSFAETLVQTSPITRGNINTEQTFIGSIHFSQSSLLAAKTQGLVLKVNFDTTQKINKGDVLVELDHEILDSKIKAVQASIKELHLLKEKSAKDLKRYKQLVQQKNVSQQKYDEIYYDKTRIDQKLISSNAEQDALLIERQQNIIKAPFDGVITERHVEIGEWVDKGGKIATLTNPKKIISLFDIPASYALNIKPDQALEVKIGEQILAGTIEGVIVKGDNKSRTFPLKVRLQSQSLILFEGMEAIIKLPRISHNDGLLVPRDAVIKRFGGDVIFIVETENNKKIAKMVPVTVHLFDGDMAAISSNEQQAEHNLNTGMQVIVKGNERVFPGQALKLLPSTEPK
ncbi:MAG: efflux RND transporter periplasmic adaptor subunit [Gammaproteobacteria bacterium]|nr:efflux RND transporter periplasmic adaptor subunit [Gammaproteobacteria bacterium]